MGYYQAGFEVVGVDIKPQKHYPFEFHQADAMRYPLTGFDVIHASPPCQHYSSCRTMHSCQKKVYPDLIAATRRRLMMSGTPYVIENVKGAPMINPCRLTGTMFNLKMHRERWFESNLFFFTPDYRGYDGHVVGKDGFVCMVGGGDPGRGRVPADHRTKSAWQTASGIDWMTMYEMTQAIPPAYTKWIGTQLIEIIDPGLTGILSENNPRSVVKVPSTVSTLMKGSVV